MNLLVTNSICIVILISNYYYKYFHFYSRILLMPFTVSAQSHILTSPFLFSIVLCDRSHALSLNTHRPLTGRYLFMLMNPMTQGLTRVHR